MNFIPVTRDIPEVSPYKYFNFQTYLFSSKRKGDVQERLREAFIKKNVSNVTIEEKFHGFQSYV